MSYNLRRYLITTHSNKDGIIGAKDFTQWFYNFASFGRVLLVLLKQWNTKIPVLSVYKRRTWSLCQRGIWNASVTSSNNCSKLAALRLFSNKEIRLNGRIGVGSTIVTTRGFIGPDSSLPLCEMLPLISWRDGVGLGRNCWRCLFGSKLLVSCIRGVFRLVSLEGVKDCQSVLELRKQQRKYLIPSQNRTVLDECVPRHIVSIDYPGSEYHHPNNA